MRFLSSRTLRDLRPQEPGTTPYTFNLARPIIFLLSFRDRFQVGRFPGLLSYISPAKLPFTNLFTRNVRLGYRWTPMPHVFNIRLRHQHQQLTKKDSLRIKRCQRCEFNSDVARHRKMPNNPTMVSTRRYSRRYFLLLSALLLLTPFTESLSSSTISNGNPKVRIQVCQNKDCCRRFQGSASLVDTLHDLIPPGIPAAHTTVESTSCLSRCETGPNLCIQRDGHPDNTSIDLRGVENAAAAVMHLQATCAIDVPSKLIAAVKVMEKAHKASSLEEKERCLSSVIQALRSDTSLAGSLAETHALVLRASARCEAGNYPAALQDAQEALAALQSRERQVNVSWQGQAWRVSADAHQALGNLPAAVEALQEWAVHTPSFRTKAMKEIQRLRSI